MAIEDVKTKKLLYHLTRLSNLDSILEHGLVSRKLVKDKSVRFFDVADQEIITKRTELGLDEYTPFHFHPYSSFDVAVKSTFADEEFIYICILREVAKHNKFKVLPRHPLNNEETYQLYEYEEGFKTIDWDTMHTLGTEERYTKSVKMAECLTNLRVPADVFQCIYVKNEDTKATVQQKLQSKGFTKKPPYVDIGPWL
ncbi:DarT ssDNA thymidine ADP-ribosyltransferase family protein [Virgibacillus halodenitrificans]|uniref:DarT ssDNA thymidine ADP-ribosyltransferase family protein n=1 Tax=Virgibacillus halodenitrificans TaxID=1482 RepID=UPI0002F84FF7|nr:DarT ssDNA thymidine ADP-ribosyltransferase family protein [Virgibacillus halodenitrificans]